MNVWRIHLKPDDTRTDAARFCVKRGIIGVGWRVSSAPRDLESYWRLGEVEYRDHHRSWSRAINAVGRRMKTGDLVWVRDNLGQYYVGRIDGPWEYRDAPEYRAVDIINVRRCQLHLVGRSVAGKIAACFRPSATVQQIRDETAELFSVLEFNKVSGKGTPCKPPEKLDIFSLLSDVDLEDVVGLYLQHEKGFLFIPSSRSRQNDTPWYEYQLIDPETGGVSCVQVKSGDEVLDPTDYYGSSDKFYLFSPAGYACTSAYPDVVCLERAEIESFIERNRRVLPRSIQTWLDWRDSIRKPGGDVRACI